MDPNSLPTEVLRALVLRAREWAENHFRQAPVRQVDLDNLASKPSKAKVSFPTIDTMELEFVDISGHPVPPVFEFRLAFSQLEERWIGKDPATSQRIVLRVP